MAVSSIPNNPNQANKVAARDELVSLPLYASKYGDGRAVARALELTKVFLPAELHEVVDAILDAQQMAASEWCVSAQEVA